jgi:saccharopine dehydrogenase-like NADP-dependent oxidoreductase
MSEKIERVAMLGLGRVGSLAATLLHETGFEVVGFDARKPRRKLPFKVEQKSVATKTEALKACKGFDAVLSCLPFHLNVGVAKAAHQLGLHYFDLTEDVGTTKAIQEMSKTSKGVMAPQCGLAPGLVGIIGAHLAEQFEQVRSIKLRVGALPQHPTGLLGYAFNWSPEGVVNEYLNDCEVIEEGQHKWVSPMEWVEKIYIDGNRLEAFTTSGGLGTMCETYLGRVDNLDYKSLRHPGHVELMNFFFHELLMRDKRELAGEILTHAKPPVDDDVVHVHVSAEGMIDGRLMRQEYVRSYYPQKIAGRSWRAIAWTTSASVAAVIEMVSRGDLPAKGFLKQELIPLEPFLVTRNGSLYETAREGRSG